MKKTITSIFCLLGVTFAFGETQQKATIKWRAWEDIKTVLDYSWRGSGLQFTHPQSYYILGAGAPVLWWAFEEDDRLTDHYGKNRDKSYYDILDAMGVIAATPLIPISLYMLARHQGDSKLGQFTLETTSAMIITLLESAFLSYFKTHYRPTDEELSSAETLFRGPYSFPSGHVAPFFVATFKTFEFFGAAWAALPLTLGLAVSYERLQSRKHYTSDIIGTLILSGMASQGVSKASGYMQSKHDITLRPIFFRDVKGVNVSFTF